MYEDVAHFGGFVFGVMLIAMLFVLGIIGIVFLAAKGMMSYESRKKNKDSNEQSYQLRLLKEQT